MSYLAVPFMRDLYPGLLTGTADLDALYEAWGPQLWHMQGRYGRLLEDDNFYAEKIKDNYGINEMPEMPEMPEMAEIPEIMTQMPKFPVYDANLDASLNVPETAYVPSNIISQSSFTSTIPNIPRASIPSPANISVSSARSIPTQGNTLNPGNGQINGFF